LKNTDYEGPHEVFLVSVITDLLYIFEFVWNFVKGTNMGKKNFFCCWSSWRGSHV